jgi:hypothetical protein
MAALDEDGLLDVASGGARLYDYAWSREPLHPVWSREGPAVVRSYEHAIPDDRCSYGEAALIAGMTEDVAEELEQGRLQFFEIKRTVLLACVQALRTDDPQPLWPSVLDILTSALLWEEAQRYLGVDELYWQVGIGERIAPSYAMLALEEVPGTLSRLLFLVGHVEKELRIGTFTRTLEGIKRARPPWNSQGIGSYFQVAGYRRRPDLDVALDGFWELEEQERAFWDVYRQRVNKALEQEFSVEVTIRTRVRRRLVTQFEPQVRTFAEWQRAHLEATGTLPALHLVQPAPSAPPKRNVFRRDGAHWTLTYDRKTVLAKDGNGMRLIAHLLGHPGQEFHVLDLVSILDGGPATVTGPREWRRWPSSASAWRSGRGESRCSTRARRLKFNVTLRRCERISTRRGI